MESKTQKTKAEVSKLIRQSKDPERVVVVWAAINYFNWGLHSRIKNITEWNAFQVLDYLVSVQWTSPKRSLDDLRRARDWANPNKTKPIPKTVKVVAPFYTRPGD
jgi:hypothetical protein